MKPGSSRLSRSVLPLLMGAAVLAAGCAGGTAAAADGPRGGVQAIVDSIRAAYDLPALGGAIVTADGKYAGAVSGVRRMPDGAPVTPDDRWHLGSNFKAFTAMLAATAVDRGEIEWTTTLAEAFPELEPTMLEAYRVVTLRDLLAHRAGVSPNPDWTAIPGQDRAEQRRSVTAWAVSVAPAGPYGAYLYSNTGYMIAAAMLERALGETFESAMASRVLAPLGITDAGYGAQDAGGAARPVGHQRLGGQWVTREGLDNPPVYASAGGAHMSIGSWARFIQEVLRVEAGNPTIVTAEAGRATTTAIVPIDGPDSYGMGWIITNRSWAGGKTLTHGGSNTANSSVAWLAPNRGFAVLAVTNAYDPSQNSRTWEALDALSARLVSYHETGR